MTAVGRLGVWSDVTSLNDWTAPSVATLSTVELMANENAFRVGKSGVGGTSSGIGYSVTTESGRESISQGRKARTDK